MSQSVLLPVSAPSTLTGSRSPRLSTAPLRPLTPSTSHGFAVIDFARDVLAEPLLPWQEELVIRALELKPDGSYRFRTIVCLVARQQGKSHVAKAVILWRLYIDNARLIMGAAQTMGIAREVWKQAGIAIMAHPDLKAELAAPIRTANGDEEIRLRSGNRYRVCATTAGAGRGYSIDMLLFDEIRQQRDWDAWSALSKTTNSRPNAQIWAISNAGDDFSVVLNGLRESAIANRDETVGLFEWSAPDGCALDDPAGWAAAMPALGYLTSEAAVRSALATDPPNIFRCLDVETPVLTTRGFIRLAHLSTVDEVKGVDGAWHAVLGVSPVYHGRDCYRVTLSDGRSLVCDAEHRWPVSDRRNSRGTELVTTSDLMRRGVTYVSANRPHVNVHNFALPVVAPLDGPDVALPVDPYFLGLWLGDGSSLAPWIAVEDRDLHQLIEEIERRGLHVTRVARDSAHCFRVSVSGQGVRSGLASAGVLGNKHIPGAYLAASLAQRRELLRGLMDSDGTCSASGQKSFKTTTGNLARGFVTLIRSLGYGAHEPVARRSQSYKPQHKSAYTITFTTADTVSSLARKNRRGPGPNRSYLVRIVSVEPVPSRPVRCIRVASPDSLFLAGDLVPTKNTEMLCQRVKTLDGAVDVDSWVLGADPTGSLRATGVPLVAVVDSAPDGRHVTLAAAGMMSDGRIRVETVAAWDSLQDARIELGGLVERNGFSVLGWFPASPAAAIGLEIRDAASKTTGAIPGKYGQAYEFTGAHVTGVCQAFSVLVSDRQIVHGDDPLLNSQIAGAKRLNVGDAWRFQRRDMGNVDAAYAAAGAVYLARLIAAGDYDVSLSAF